MQTEKNPVEKKRAPSPKRSEETVDTSLSWLLDLDFTDQEETLFVLPEDSELDMELSAEERDIASRPMFRGNPGKDDLNEYVEEEIVLSSSESKSDIFDTQATGSHEDYPVNEGNIAPAVVLFRQPSDSSDNTAENTACEGADFLSLVADPEFHWRDERSLTTDDTSANKSASVKTPEHIETDNCAPTVAGPHQENTDWAQGELAIDSHQPPAVDSVIEDDDPEQLSAIKVEGIESVDPELGDNIEYHPDFTALTELVHNSFGEITTVISRVMEEIQNAIPEQLRAMGRENTPVAVDVKLGQDEESIAHCLDGGFQPLTLLCHEPPRALQNLGQQEIDAIYLRFFHSDTNETVNRWFAPEDDIDDAFAGFEESAADSDLNGQLVEELIAEEGETEPEEAPILGENLFDGESACEFESTGVDLPADVEAAFADSQIAVQMTDEVCGIDTEEFFQEAVLEDQAVHPEPKQSDPALAVPVPPEELPWFIPAGIRFNHSSQSASEVFADFLDAFLEEGATELEKLEESVSNWEAEPTGTETFTVVTRTLHTLKGIAKGVGLHRYGTLIHNFETLLEGLSQPAENDWEQYFRIVNTWLDSAVQGFDVIREQRGDIASELPGALPSIPSTPSTPATPATPTTDDRPLDMPEVQENEALKKEPPARESTADNQQIEKIQQVEEVAKVEEVREVGEIEKLEKAKEANEPKPPVIPADKTRQRDKTLADEGARTLAAQQSVRITSEKLDQLLNLSQQAQQFGVRASQAAQRGRRAAGELQSRLNLVRAHIAKIADRALLSASTHGHKLTNAMHALEMDQYSELQEAASILREGIEDLNDLANLTIRQNSQMDSLLKQQASVLSSINGTIQSARVIPLSRLMPGLRRLVRTVSNDLGKKVKLEVVNELGALDRDNYARCQTMLEHMVRNALDHGIETPAERQATGKPVEGNIHIDIRKAGGDYVVGLSDDGRGIDPEKMRQTAIRKGLDVDPQTLTDDEAIRLIFHKGLSTAESLSEISGRGVGMDIVLSELQQMGGDIRIDSKPGKGTRFELHIPSNVTLNGALLVSVGENRFAIPLDGLHAVDYIPADSFFAALEQNKPLELQGKTCVPAYLGQILGHTGCPPRNTWRDTIPVMVAGHNEARAIAVDDVEEALELVIRSLGSQFATVLGLAGAATTSDGNAIVALDLNLLADHAETGLPKANTDTGIAASTPLVLVVDDSRTQRMVATSQLETLGVETATAENGLAALQYLDSCSRLPDIVLLDIEMPVKDGIQTLREIRTSRRYGHLPVIMITSRTGATHRALAEEAGCNAYQGKPFNFGKLVEQINRLTDCQLLLH